MGRINSLPARPTSNNQRLGNMVDVLDLTLFLLCQVGGHLLLQNLRGMPDTRPKIHSFIHSSAQTRLQCVLQKCVFSMSTAIGDTTGNESAV